MNFFGEKIDKFSSPIPTPQKTIISEIFSNLMKAKLISNCHEVEDSLNLVGGVCLFYFRDMNVFNIKKLFQTSLNLIIVICPE